MPTPVATAYANDLRYADKLRGTFDPSVKELYRSARFGWDGLDARVRFVMNCLYESETYYRPIRTKFEDWDNQYFGIPAAKKYDWMANIWVPATHKAIWMLAARAWKILFGSKTKFFELEPVGEDDAPYKDVNEGTILYEWRQGKADFTFLMSILQTLIRGTSILKVPWRVQTAHRSFLEMTEEPIYEVMIDPATGQPMFQPQANPDERPVPMTHQVGVKPSFQRTKKEVELFRGPKLELVDLFDYYPDPRIVTPEDDGYQIQRSWTTFGALKELERRPGENGEIRGIYQNVDAVCGTSPPGVTDFTARHRRLYDLGVGNAPAQRMAESITGRSYEDDKGIESTAALQGDVELIEWHGLFDVDGDNRLEKTIMTVANRQVMIRPPEETPYYHGRSDFVKMGFKPTHTNDFFWQGVCEIIEPLQEELNLKHNQRIDNINQVLQPILAYVENSIDADVLRNFRFAPGNMLRVKDTPSSIMDWKHAPDVTQSAIREEMKLEEEIEGVIPAPRLYMPSTELASIHPTAQGLGMAGREADANIAILLELMEISGLVPCVERYHWLNQQFITTEYVAKIMGKAGVEFRHVLPEEVQRNFDVHTIGAMSALRRVRDEQAVMRLFEIARTMPPGSIVDDKDPNVKLMVNLKLMLEELWRLEDLPFADRLFIPLPPPPMLPIMQGGEAGGPGGMGEGGIAQGMEGQPPVPTGG